MMRYLFAAILLLASASDVRATGAVSTFLGAITFPPITHIYTTPTSGTETVPTGARSVTITIDGGGGSDAGGGAASAGGGGARSVKTVAIVPGDWGASLSYTVGGGGQLFGSQPAADGGDTKCMAVLSAGSIGMTAGGGSHDGTGGTASGGDTNTSGGNKVGTTGGAGASGAAGGASGVNGTAPGGGGGLGAAGANGQVQFVWS